MSPEIVDSFWNEFSNLDLRCMVDSDCYHKSVKKKPTGGIEKFQAKFGDRFIETVKDDVPCFDKFK